MPAVQGSPITPSVRSVLAALTKARLLDMAREQTVAVPASATKDAISELLVASRRLRFDDLMQRLARDELRAACRAHALPADSRSRPALVAELLRAHGAGDSVPPAQLFSPRSLGRELPEPGDIVRCRQRQWLVEDVVEAPADGDATRVRLVCLDDDNQGRALAPACHARARGPAGTPRQCGSQLRWQLRARHGFHAHARGTRPAGKEEPAQRRAHLPVSRRRRGEQQSRPGLRPLRHQFWADDPRRSRTLAGLDRDRAREGEARARSGQSRHTSKILVAFWGQATSLVRRHRLPSRAAS